MQLNGSYRRRIRCGEAEIVLDFWRVRCSICGKTFVPLKRFIRVEHYQTKTNELEQLVVEVASETSCRRGVAALKRDSKIELPHRTAHDWVISTDCDEIQLSPKVSGSTPAQILPDGTKFKGQGKSGKAKQGDLKVVIGVNTASEVFPLGSWAGTSWGEINQAWKENELKLPQGSIVISDGELGRAEAFAGYVEEQQCCHWHIKQDLYHAMHQDGGTIKDSKPLQDTGD